MASSGYLKAPRMSLVNVSGNNQRAEFLCGSTWEPVSGYFIYEDFNS